MIAILLLITMAATADSASCHSSYGNITNIRFPFSLNYSLSGVSLAVVSVLTVISVFFLALGDSMSLVLCSVLQRCSLSSYTLFFSLFFCSLSRWFSVYTFFFSLGKRHLFWYMHSHLNIPINTYPKNNILKIIHTYIYPTYICICIYISK